jgi:hypothetical protein
MANQLTQRNCGKCAPPRFVLFHGYKIRSYRRGLILRWARVALAMLVAFTIAYILITSDPTDDVDGILRQNHPTSAHRMLAASLWEFQTRVIVLFHLFTFPRCTRHLAAFDLLDVTSVCRC